MMPGISTDNHKYIGTQSKVKNQLNLNQEYINPEPSDLVCKLQLQ